MRHSGAWPDLNITLIQILQEEYAMMASTLSYTRPTSDCRRDKGRQRAFVDLTKDEDDINSIALGSNGKHLAAGKNAAPHNDDSDAVELLPDEARVLRAPKRQRLAQASCFCPGMQLPSPFLIYHHILQDLYATMC